MAKVYKAYWRFVVRIKAKNVGRDLKVHLRSYVTENTYLGNNVNFNGMTMKGGGKIKIGDNFHSGEGCLLIANIHNYDHGNAIPYDNNDILKEIIIKDNVWLGDRVIILGGVIIEEGAIIQAGSVVVRNVPKCAIAGGHPAKVFKYRDIEHYEQLKKEKKFN